MNSGKLVSGIAALAIYLSLIFLVLYFYNIHQTKAKNFVEKNADRVTVTLVNSEKTVFNKSEKTSNPKKPVPQIVPPIVAPIIKKVEPQKVVSKKITPPKRITPPKEIQPKKIVPKKVVPKKEVPKKVTPKKITPPKKVVPKKIAPKKVVPKKVEPKKEVPKKVVPKKTIPKKVVPKKVVPPKKKVPPKTAKDLFASVKTKEITKRPVKTTPKPVIKQPSSIKHNSSVTDRIKATHQSGRTSNANRQKGEENRYKARVYNHMNNWIANGNKGQKVVIKLTVYQSGKFKYRIASGVSGVMSDSLKRHLDILNHQGLGRHKNLSSHTFTVNFKIRQ
ncbi:MAG: M-like protein [uncultured Sulfurovum sp.]|uniref:M-like protein n=1 Tax=uncultured Sulfurovum sp. TaxID=269237 RepID=A0A6S6U1R1_9BACT|nr:MAG: M-like protein [uncultured Sulfurovum sp.]